MGALAAVGVDDDFATRQARIAVRTTDDEFSRGIDFVIDFSLEQCEHLFVALLLDAGYEDVDDVVLDLRQHGLVVVHELVVLGRDHDGVNALWHALVAVLDGHLALRVGPEVGHLLALAANVGQGAHDEVGELQRHGHVVGRFVGGIAEHHALVAGSLVLFFLAVDAAVDVAALLVNGSEDAAGIAVELVFRLRVSDFVDGAAGHGL